MNNTHEGLYFTLYQLNMEVASPGANGHAPSSIPSTTIDPNLVVQHLVDHLEVTLGASAEDLESSGCLLCASKRQDTIQRCTRFASESQNALYVLKDVVSPDLSSATQGVSGIDSAYCYKDSKLITRSRKQAPPPIQLHPAIGVCPPSHCRRPRHSFQASAALGPSGASS